jgi:hypothetical protein
LGGVKGAAAMPNLHKIGILEALRTRFGELQKIPGSQSLFRVGEDAARIYIRYSKVHPGGGSFFGIREVDLRQLEGRNSFLCFLADNAAPPLFVPYADFEEVFATPKRHETGSTTCSYLQEAVASSSMSHVRADSMSKATWGLIRLAEALIPIFSGKPGT